MDFDHAEESGRNENRSRELKINEAETIHLGGYVTYRSLYKMRCQTKSYRHSFPVFSEGKEAKGQ